MSSKEKIFYIKVPGKLIPFKFIKHNNVDYDFKNMVLSLIKINVNTSKDISYYMGMDDSVEVIENILVNYQYNGYINYQKGKPITLTEDGETILNNYENSNDLKYVNGYLIYDLISKNIISSAILGTTYPDNKMINWSEKCTKKIYENNENSEQNDREQIDIQLLDNKIDMLNYKDKLIGYTFGNKNEASYKIEQFIYKGGYRIENKYIIDVDLFMAIEIRSYVFNDKQIIYHESDIIPKIEKSLGYPPVIFDIDRVIRDKYYSLYNIVEGEKNSFVYEENHPLLVQAGITDNETLKKNIYDRLNKIISINSIKAPWNNKEILNFVENAEKYTIFYKYSICSSFDVRIHWGLLLERLSFLIQKFAYDIMDTMNAKGIKPISLNINNVNLKSEIIHRAKQFDIDISKFYGYYESLIKNPIKALNNTINSYKPDKNCTIGSAINILLQPALLWNISQIPEYYNRIKKIMNLYPEILIDFNKVKVVRNNDQHRNYKIQISVDNMRNIILKIWKVFAETK